MIQAFLCIDCGGSVPSAAGRARATDEQVRTPECWPGDHGQVGGEGITPIASEPEFRYVLLG